METKGVTCKIPLELHNRISEEIRETESTMSKFIEMIITEHYEKGAVTVMEKGRTLAFQVSEELFQRVKEYLEAYEKAYHRRLTQKEFVIGLIEQALEEAEEELAIVKSIKRPTEAMKPCLIPKESGSVKTSKKPIRAKCPTLTSCAEVFPASLFRLLETAEASQTREVPCSLKLPG